MPTILFKMDIRDVDEHLIVDPLVWVRLARPDAADGQKWRLAADGTAATHRLEDAPVGSPLRLRISPSRYRDIGMFAQVNNGRLIPDASVMKTPRQPSEWLPAFDRWATLSDDFDALTTLLLASSVFQLGRGSKAGCLDEAAYDAVDADDPAAWRAKMALLNLYSRMSVEGPPSTNKIWIGEVSQLFLGTSERLIGETNQDCFDTVRSLSDSPGGGYKHARPDLHKKNFELVPGVANVREMASIKTDVSKANLQITVARATRQGEDICLIDADIDEHGELLAHTFDLVRHIFTKGTDPIDLHESLRELFPERDLGYLLDPRAPVGRVTATVRGATR